MVETLFMALTTYKLYKNPRYTCIMFTFVQKIKFIDLQEDSNPNSPGFQKKTWQNCHQVPQYKNAVKAMRPIHRKNCYFPN